MHIDAVYKAEQMQGRDRSPSPGGSGLRTPLQQCLEDKETDSPNYRRNFERVVTNWIGFAEQQGARSIDDVSKRMMADYASDLTRRINAGEISTSTAWTYYDYVASFLSWAVAWDLIGENPARKREAEANLPERPSNSESDRQFWSPEQRRTVVAWVTDRARSAIDHPLTPMQLRQKRFRDRALVCTIAYSGARGGEIVADSNDHRRNGLTWADVDLEAGTMRILGKSQQLEDTQLPEQAASPLERWRSILDPPSEEWPVFPTMHRPTLSHSLSASVEAGSWSSDPWGYHRENGETPPSITTAGLRSLLERLSAVADVPDLAPGEYLEPHGGRRGVGEKLYRARGHADAQRALRHADPATTSNMYSHIEASERAEDVSAVFESE